MEIIRKISALALVIMLGVMTVGCGQLTDEELALYEGSGTESSVSDDITEPLTETETTSYATETEHVSEEPPVTVTTETSTTEAVTEVITTETETISPAIDNQPQQNIIGSDYSIIPGISIGMTEKEVFALVGKGYISDTYYDYKERTEYRYRLDKIEHLGIEMTSTMFFEFDTKGSLACFGYHIGEVEDEFGITYPYAESELSAAYNSVYSQLTEHYGEGLKESMYADMGVKSEYSWTVDGNLLWFVWGINMWGWEAPESYEFGCNDIVLSVSVP